MKKENKIKARELQAKQRAAKKRKELIKNIFVVGVPLLVVILLFVLVLTSKDDEQTTTTSNVATTTEAPTYNPTKGVEVKNGDKVNIAFTGYINGEKFEGGTSDSYIVVLGSNSLIDGFEEGIVGKKVGENFDLNLSFPSDYWNAEYAGKDVVFNVTLNGVY